MRKKSLCVACMIYTNYNPNNSDPFIMFSLLRQLLVVVTPPHHWIPLLIAVTAYHCKEDSIRKILVRDKRSLFMKFNPYNFTHQKLVMFSRNCSDKILISGESAVGKSSLVLRFVKGQFHEYQETTIGAAFLTQTVTVDGVTVKFEIWDTAGAANIDCVTASAGCEHLKSLQ